MQDMPKSRIASILRQHAVLFGDGIVRRDPWVRREAEELVSALDAPSATQALRIASILRQHALLFGHGAVLATEETVVEDGDLLALLGRRGGDGAPGFDASGLRELPSSSFLLPEADGRPAAAVPAAARYKAPAGPEDPHREFRLFGEGRRSAIPEKAGLFALWCRDPGSRSASLLLFPLSSVERHVLDPEPVQLWIAGPLHAVLVETVRTARGGLRHEEWPAALGATPDPDSMLAVHTGTGDRICLGMRPLVLGDVRHVTAAAEAGIRSYFFPGDGGLPERLTGFLASVFRAHIGVSRSDADGVAWFAVRRILRRR